MKYFRGSQRQWKESGVPSSSEESICLPGLLKQTNFCSILQNILRIVCYNNWMWSVKRLTVSFWKKQQTSRLWIELSPFYFPSLRDTAENLTTSPGRSWTHTRGMWASDLFCFVVFFYSVFNDKLSYRTPKVSLPGPKGLLHIQEQSHRKYVSELRGDITELDVDWQNSKLKQWLASNGMSWRNSLTLWSQFLNKRLWKTRDKWAFPNC